MSCNNGSCGTSHSSGHGHHDHSCGCGSSCGCGCKSKSCECSCHDYEEHHFSKELLRMADDAWMDLLQDKIQEKIAKAHGAELDKLAELVATTNQAKWANKLKSKDDCNAFAEKVAEFFHNKH